MKLRHWLVATAGALVLSVTATTARAAPVGATTGDFKIAAGNTFSVQKAHHHPRHHCRWRHGHLHCWWARYSYYDDYYYPYAYGPSVGIIIGGHRHHHHHRHHRR